MCCVAAFLYMEYFHVRQGLPSHPITALPVTALEFQPPPPPLPLALKQSDLMKGPTHSGFLTLQLAASKLTPPLKKKNTEREECGGGCLDALRAGCQEQDECLNVELVPLLDQQAPSSAPGLY